MSIDDIRTLISANKVSEAIDKMIELAGNVGDTNLLNDITTISANYQQNERKDSINTLNNHEYSVSRSKIISGLSEILTQIEKDSLKTLSTTQTNKNTYKEEILKLIVSDIDMAFDKLDDYFGNANGIYNDLNKEYTSRPNNFDMDTFRSKLRRFVKKNLV